MGGGDVAGICAVQGANADRHRKVGCQRGTMPVTKTILETRCPACRDCRSTMTSTTQLAIESCLCCRKRSTVRLIRVRSCLANDAANHGGSPGVGRAGEKATPGAAREGAAQVAEVDRAAAGRAIRSNAYLLPRSHECFTVDNKHNFVSNARFGPHKWNVGECAFHTYAVEANLDNQQTVGI